MRYMYTHVFTIQFKVVWIRFRVACYFKKREFLVFLSFLKKIKHKAQQQTVLNRMHENTRTYPPFCPSKYVYLHVSYHRLLYSITYTRNNIIRCRKAKSATAVTSFCPTFAWEPGTWSPPADRRSAWS